MKFTNRTTNNKYKRGNRINFVLAIIFLFIFFIIIKLFSLQIINGNFFKEACDDQQSIRQTLTPERGKIFLEDRENKNLYPVATNLQLFLVYAEPRIIEEPLPLIDNLIEILTPFWIEEFNIDKKFESKSKTTNSLEKSNEVVIFDEDGRKLNELDIFLKKKKDDIREKILKNKDPYEELAKKVPEDIVNKIKALNERGIGYQKTNFRYYPEAQLLSGVSGFVGYYDNEQRGQYGVEGYFDELLRGKPGSLNSKKDAFGYVIMTKESDITPAKKGYDIVLTIDRSIQFKACEELKKAVEEHEADSGSVVIMNPETGAILALCVYPDYDANYYNKESNLEIFTNTAVSEQYEPGSIFKAITVAAGIDDGKISPNTTYYDEGCIKIGPDKICNSDGKSHKIQNMTQLLEASLNTGTIFVLNQIGRDTFQEYVKNFGFGEQSGIELASEGFGNIKSLELDREIYSATASFGQGISVTPLQMVNSFAAIANGGSLMKPYIVQRIIKENGTEEITSPEKIRQVISKKTSLLLSGMLGSVVENGHGKQAGVPGYYIAGKTGTAEIPKKDGGGYEKDMNIGSFAGFGPIENPKFAMLVRIDNPKGVIWAESSAAPLFGKIAKFILDYYEIKPSY